MGEDLPRRSGPTLSPAPASIMIAVGVALLLFLTTYQTTVNGSPSPYTTDVGEIQNALPRWGTIHWTGYPLYTILGSTFVTLLRWAGIEPASGASLFSTLWGLVSVGLIVALLQELEVPGPLAIFGALIAATSLSMWMDASLAEVHTMTMAFTVATLLFALRFDRTGRRSDFLWLAFVFSQGVIHQRAVLFLLPAVATLVLRPDRWRVLWRGLLPALGISLLAPLTYLYLPWRVQQGATWTFGTPGTWQGVLRMLFDNRADRIVTWPEGLGGWAIRIGRAFAITAADLHPALLALGLLGLLVLVLRGGWRQALALTLAWIPYILLTGLIWIGRVGDAQLAAHLPVTILAAVGLALLAASLNRRVRWGYPLGILALVAIVAFLILVNRPQVLAVTRDPSAEAIITTAERASPPPGGGPAAFMALWGHDYWALAYAHTFQGRLEGLDVVDHNAHFEAILAEGNRLFTLNKTFYRLPVAWWEERLGRIYLSTVAPRVVEIGLEPMTWPNLPAEPVLDLGDGIRIRAVDLAATDSDALWLTVYWETEQRPTRDYSVAVHLVAQDPPQRPEDVLAQADRQHPIYGRYPTSRWEAGEIVRSDYLIPVPPSTAPKAVRIALYRVDASGDFITTPWLSLPISDAE